MKKIFLLLLLFENCCGQNLLPLQSSSFQSLNTLYNSTSFSSLADFNQTGSFTSTASSNVIHISGGSSSFTAALDLEAGIGTHMLNNWSVIAVLKATSKASSGAMSIGIRSINTTSGTQSGLSVSFRNNTGSNGGKVLIQGGSGMPTIYTSTEVISFSVNDVISITATMVENYLYVDCYNVTTSSAHTYVNYYYNTASTAVLRPNTGKFCVWALGGFGTFDVQSLNVSSGEIVGAKILVHGDSKTNGYLVSNIHNTYCHKLQDNLIYRVVNYAGPSDGSAEFVASSTFVINYLKPKYVMIAGCSNDPRNGVAAGTTQSNISSVVTAYQNAGINVILITGFYETSGNNQTVYQTWVNANYSSGMIIDMLGTTLTLGDTIHPNDGGNTTITNTIVASGKMPSFP